MDNAINEYKEYFDTICEISSVGLFRTNKNGDYVYINKKYEIITGKPSEKLLNDGWITTIHKRDIQKVLAEWKRCITEQKKFTLEYRIVNNKKTIWVLNQATPINGEQKGYVGIITNINKRKKLLDELLELRSK